MSAKDMQLAIPGDSRGSLQLVVLLSLGGWAANTLWKAVRRGPSQETEQPMRASHPVKKLWHLYAETWDELCKWDPINATMNGDDRNNSRLADLSEEARRNHVNKLREIQRKLYNVPFKDLRVEVECSNYLFLKEFLRLEIRAIETFERHEFPAHHLFGPHVIITQLPAIQKVRNNKEAKAFVQRLRAFDQQVTQMIDAFRAGMKSGNMLHLHAVQSMIRHCQEQLCATGAESPIYQMMAARFRSVGGDPDSLRAAVEDSLTPAFQRLSTFLKDEYVWEARKHPGVWSLPDGDDFYAGCLEYFTSLSTSAEELHQQGLNEVKRITEKMLKVRRLLGVNEGYTNAEYAQTMREDTENFYETSDQILDRYQQILEKADEKMPLYFQQTPNSQLIVKAIDALHAEFAPPAHYSPGDPAHNTPAMFFANTSHPETRPKYQLEAVALHEGVPGHHVQLGLTQELKGLPRLRRSENPCCLSFVQGWALYAEYLGEVMGFYEDPRNYFGRLLTELCRAARMVVDTGIHHKRWSREEAALYMKNNACMTDTEIASELDRIITMPGQAVTFKVGEQRILDLKNFAERRLEDNFSWRSFHDAVLRFGTLPLSVIDSNTVKWVTTEERRKLLGRHSSTGSDKKRFDWSRGNRDSRMSR